MKKTLLTLALFSVISAFAQEKAVFTCYFGLNEYVLPQDSVAKFKAWLREVPPPVSISVSAFTDTLGTVPQNQVLAQRRLNTVLSMLSGTKGVSLQKEVIGESYGKEGYRNNPAWRKVEVTIAYNGGPVNIPVETGQIVTGTINKIETFANSTGPVNLNIQFVGGQDIYIGNSHLEVEVLYQYLKQNPTVKAFIRGHVCCAADPDLSILRAYAVYSDLLAKGISADRISYRGYSNTIPVMAEVDDYSRQMNRRVDVIFTRE